MLPRQLQMELVYILWSNASEEDLFYSSRQYNLYTDSYRTSIGWLRPNLHLLGRHGLPPGLLACWTFKHAPVLHSHPQELSGELVAYCFDKKYKQELLDLAALWAAPPLLGAQSRRLGAVVLVSHRQPAAQPLLGQQTRWRGVGVCSQWQILSLTLSPCFCRSHKRR